ncbi:MAG: NAD(P)-binding protein [Candidatus Lokiarchaeota archaeon]|nr:NAD(P)-binding protein [Candidatus Lokiarchaeota archaeon]
MKLLEPLEELLPLRNRMVFLATHLGYCEEGFVSDRLVRFYQERAKYQPGLIIVGGCFTEHLGMSSPSMVGISNDAHISGLGRLVDSIHQFGVPVAAQLYHAGRYTHSLVIGEQAVSASAVKCRLTRETPRALNIDEIENTIRNFGLAAKRAKKAGFDAVEILGSAGYILNQFLAKATNKRDDEYGGDFQSRAKFPLEVVYAVRKAVGPSYPVMYRISGEDFIPEGVTLDDNKILVPQLVEAGVDILDVTGGWHETRVPQITMDVPRGHYAYLAEGLAEVVDIPVIACNRINSPTIAEKILSRGKVDLIGMSRAFIADPAFPEKVRTGRTKIIRPCVACNQGCLDRVFLNKPVTCILNAEASFENVRSIPYTDSSEKIAVVGAGPSGLEAARVLAERGFEVHLFESRKQIGGLLRFAARTPKRGEFLSYITYMKRELKRLGVKIHLNSPCTAEMLEQGQYDSIFLATGFIPVLPEIEGLESPKVLSVIDLLENQNIHLGQTVILGGNHLGCSAALFAISRSDSVQIIESSSRIGDDIGLTSRWIFIKALEEMNVVIQKEVDVNQYTGNYLMLSRDGSTSMLLADTLIVAGSLERIDRLATGLEKLDLDFIFLTENNNAMNLLSTIHSAYKIASEYKR